MKDLWEPLPILIKGGARPRTERRAHPLRMPMVVMIHVGGVDPFLQTFGGTGY